MNKWILLLFFLPLFLPACRKKKEKPMMKITGRVSDKADNSGISGASVSIYYKPYENGVYSSTFSSLAGTSTDGSGNFSFEIEKPNSSDFKFVVQANNYFNVEKLVNPDNLSTSDENNLNFETDPSTMLLFHFKNIMPVDADDHLQFHPMGMTIVCATCCTNAVTDYSGMTVDASFSCIRYAKRYFKYQYYVTKGGATTGYLDSVYCTFGSAVNVNINY